MTRSKQYLAAAAAVTAATVAPGCLDDAALEDTHQPPALDGAEPADEVLDETLDDAIDEASSGPQGTPWSVDVTCKPNFTISYKRELEAEGYAFESTHPQLYAWYAWGTTLYWRDTTAYRMIHPDGRIKYATCKGAMGPDFPVAGDHTGPATWRRYEPSLVQPTTPRDIGTSTVTVTVKDFRLVGPTGFDPELRVELTATSPKQACDFNGKACVTVSSGARRLLRVRPIERDWLRYQTPPAGSCATCGPPNDPQLYLFYDPATFDVIWSGSLKIISPSTRWSLAGARDHFISVR